MSHGSQYCVWVPGAIALAPAHPRPSYSLARLKQTRNVSFTHSPPFLLPLHNPPPPFTTSTMPPKRPATASTSSTPRTPSTPSQSSTQTTSLSKPSSSKQRSQSAQDILAKTWDNYWSKTAQRTKLTDAFMAFLVVVGGVQFLYCLVVGNYVSSCFFGWLELA